MTPADIAEGRRLLEAWRQLCKEHKEKTDAAWAAEPVDEDALNALIREASPIPEAWFDWWNANIETLLDAAEELERLKRLRREP